MPEASRTPASARVYVALIVTSAILALGLSALFDPYFMKGGSAAVPALLTFTVVGFLLELAEHRLAVSATGSIAFIAFLAAALVFGPTWGTAVTAVSIFCAHAVNHRPWLKISFNVSQYALSALFASAVYLGLGGKVPPALLDATVLPFGAMVFTFFAVNSLAVSGVVALSDGRPLAEVWLRNTWSLAAYDLMASTIALAVAILFSRYGVFAVAGVIAPILFLRHIYMVNLQLQAANREMLDVMVKSIEARDPYTSGHSQRVAELAKMLSKEMGLGLREIDSIATAALLHDVGKIYEEFAPLLRKESRLSPGEHKVMRSHSIRSAELVGTVSGLRGYVEKAVRHHHENYDGSGYPEGQSGEGIPTGARIIMVADTVDAMTSHRPYRSALSYGDVVRELERFSGRQFDPVIVQVFLQSTAARSYVESQVGQATEPRRTAHLAAS